MKCAICQIDYPPELIRPLRVGTISTKGLSIDSEVDMCGICALEASNKAHNINRKKFDGPIAEKLRLAAIEHREKTKQLPVRIS